MNDSVHKPLSRQAVIELLSRHGVQPTQQRVQIGLVLFEKDRHLSAEDVLSLLNHSKARVSKATIYNTLGLFVEKGLIRQVIVDPARIFYDPNLRPHHHFYHVDSGELEDVDAERFEINQLPDLPAGTVAEGVDVIIRVRRSNTATH